MARTASTSSRPWRPTPRAPPSADGRRPRRRVHNGSMFEAVIFDLDGVLIDSEQAWARAREQLVRERGGVWRSDATRAMMGMSSPEWSRYMRDTLSVDMEPEEIAAEVVRRLERSEERRVGKECECV